MCFQKNVSMLLKKKRRLSLLLMTEVSSDDFDKHDSDEKKLI